MKTPSLLRPLLVSFALLAGTALCAAESVHLYLKGSKTPGRVISCPDGACVIKDLAPDTYTVTLCDKDGKALPPDKSSQRIVSPRDIATGQASGKRQHGPVRITKEWDSSSAQLSFTVTEAGGEVSFVCDHNSTRSNKTSK